MCVCVGGGGWPRNVGGEWPPKVCVGGVAS